MARRICDTMMEFAEESGGMTWRELVDYSRHNNERWFKHLIGPYSVRVRFEVGVRGWDPSITPEGIQKNVSDMLAGNRGVIGYEDRVKLATEILSDARFAAWAGPDGLDEELLPGW